MSSERAAMKAYVTGADHLQFTQLAEGMVQVNATHSNLKQFVMELRLDLHSSIGDVKRKLQTHNGTPPAFQTLHLRDEAGADLCVMSDDARPLGYYGVRNGCVIHCVDSDPYSLSRDGGLDDVSRIEKYRMSEAEYDAREGTLRSYKKAMLAADPTFRFLPENRRPAGSPGMLPIEVYEDPAVVGPIQVGMRCEVAPGGRRGTVGYVGLVESLGRGYWIGVKLDEPLGKGDGSRGGVKFFDAMDKFGAFVRPDLITLGDFEEEDGLDACGPPVAAVVVPLEAVGTNTAGEKGPEHACCAPAPAAATRSTRRRRGEDEDDDDDDEL